MPIAFCGSPATTLGIELELGLVDRRTRALVGAATEVLAELGSGRPGGEHPFVKHELFQCTVEVITDVCEDVAAARKDLEASLAEVRRVLEPRGLALIGSGTHPFSRWQDLEVSPLQRYTDLVEALQWPARRMAIHGVHFHVGVPSGEHAIAAVNALAFDLPVFLALSASSPYWLGDDTGMASARTKIFEGLPTAGLPPRLADWADFERFMQSLLTARVVNTIREVWWDVRPHPDFGTVELRMCDGITSMDEVAAVAALAHCLVADLCDRFERGERVEDAREWIVRENKWLASRYGLDTSLIVDDAGHRRPAVELVEELVERLRPWARRLHCVDELEHVRVMVERGPSYRRQRSMVEQGAGMHDVVDALVREHEVGLA